MTTSRPVIHESHPNDLNQLTALPYAMVAAKDLKPGHLVLDPDLLTPFHSLDRRLRAPRNSGSVRFGTFNHEDRRFDEVTLSPAVLVPVHAAAAGR